MRAMGKPIAYYPKLAKPLGGVNSAILFSQLFYWQDKATSELGVYKTRDELEDETGLSHNEQRTAVKKLCEKGVLIVTEKRLEHKTFYKIDNEKVNQVLSDFASSMITSSRDIKSIPPELDIVDVGTTTKSSSLDQEITTKNTTEITTNIIAAKTQTQKRACQIPDHFEPMTVKPKNVSIDVWKNWIDYRNSLGKKLQPQSWIKQSQMLEEQENPEAMINQSIMNGWQGLFPLKNAVAAGKPVSDTSWINDLNGEMF